MRFRNCPICKKRGKCQYEIIPDSEEPCEYFEDSFFEKLKPNFYTCGGGSEYGECMSWDDINGCWENCEEYCGKNQQEFEEEHEEELEEGW